MKQQEILVRAALHYHNWTPGTAYAELEYDIMDMFKTVRELSETLDIDRPTFQEFKQLLREAAR